MAPETPANFRPFLPGDAIGGCRVVKHIGKGASGEVFLAKSPDGTRQLAAKILYCGDDPGGGFARRFAREADFAMRARHPNLVEVYASEYEPERGCCWMVMEYMPLGSLRSLIDSSPGGLAVETVVSVAKDVANALAFVSANGLVHRDVKPDNILLAENGSAKLADLGISRFREPSPGQNRMTEAGDVVGTPAYMAPEQMLDSRSVDQRADVYSLGVVMYEMLAGRRPNEGENALKMLANAIEGRSFPDVRTLRPEAPAALAALVAEMTDPDPSRRPVSAAAVASRLSRPLSAPASVPPPALAGPGPAGARKESFDRYFALAAAAAALSAATLAFVAIRTLGGF